MFIKPALRPVESMSTLRSENSAYRMMEWYKYK
jgi:hypothetical protein